MTAPMTLTEKVLARASGATRVAPGDEIWAKADRIVMNDASGPRRLAPLVAELGGVRDPSRVVVASDHFAPASTIRHAEILRTTRTWARDERIGHFFEYEGILHNLVLERGCVLPGMLLVGADSHTVTAGAAGAVAVAVGSTELATVLATGEVWLRVPDTLRVDLHGALADMVDLRDVTMTMLRDHGLAWASYRAVEYGGTFVEPLTVEDRLVLANQAIEMGAKNGVVVPSAALVRVLGDDAAATALFPDEGARYLERHRYDVARLAPLVAAHPTPDNVCAAADVAKTPIDMAWIGSCVGGRLADLRAAARVLRGRRARVPLLVTPSTAGIYRAALADGTIAALAEAGAVVQPPGCGACAGVHAGVQGPGDVVLATATRNFKGRMGSVDAKVMLASAYTVAASAVAGHVVDPRELGAGGAA